MKTCGYTEVVIDGKHNGICGYIALGMLLSYYGTYQDVGWTRSGDIVFEEDGDYSHPSTQFNFLLYSIARNLGKGTSSISTDLKDVMNVYKNNLFFDIKHTSLWTPFFSQTTITNLINRNLPVILFGDLDSAYDPNIKGKHAVLAYGYLETKESGKKKKYNIVHFGWDGYSQIYLSTSNILGSIYTVEGN